MPTLKKNKKKIIRRLVKIKIKKIFTVKCFVPTEKIKIKYCTTFRACGGIKHFNMCSDILCHNICPKGWARLSI